MDMDVVINGRVLSMPLNGIPRYAWETIKQLDKMDTLPFNITVVVPSDVNLNVKYKKIKLVKLKSCRAWDYLQAEKYAKNHNAIYINFASKGVLYKKSITTIHDVRPLSFGDGKITYKSLLSKLKFRISFKLASKNAEAIVTVSMFSKKEIQKYSSADNIEIIGNGWEHVTKISEDVSVFSDNPQIKKGEYYLSVSSIAPHKNFKWIVENAKFNPNTQYVVVGKTDARLWNDETDKFSGNVIYLGFQDDEKMKALMQGAKSLIFPSLYEGFGIPPLEALSCGTTAIVSDIPVMREIYQNSVYYIDPFQYEVNLNKITETKIPKQNIDDTLEKNTWKHAAEKWIDLICRLKEKMYE